MQSIRFGMSTIMERNSQIKKELLKGTEQKLMVNSLTHQGGEDSKESFFNAGITLESHFSEHTSPSCKADFLKFK